MRVLHLLSSFELGGAEKLLLDLIEENRRQNKLDFVIVVMNSLLDEGMKERLVAAGYPVYFLNRPETHRHPKYLFQLLKLIKRHRIQLVHAHTYGSKVWAVLCKAFVRKLKVVFTVHDMNVLRRSGKLHLLLHRYGIDINLAISDAVKKDAVARGVTNTVRIYNGIHLDRFQPDGHGLPDLARQTRIVQVARITHGIKGQDILIRAVKLCKDRGLPVSCTFIGGVYEYDRQSYDDLVQLVRELGLEEEVRFLGSRRNVNELLPQYDIFVLPSRNEGLGLVLLEAMASGIPVIASDVDGPAELIRHGDNGLLFRTESHEDLAVQLELLIGNEELRKSMTDRAGVFVQDFDISRMLDAYSNLYRDLIHHS